MQNEPAMVFFKTSRLKLIKLILNFCEFLIFKQITNKLKSFRKYFFYIFNKLFFHNYISLRYEIIIILLTMHISASSQVD